MERGVFMDETGEGIFQMQGPAGTLPIKAKDKVMRQPAMIIEPKCLGPGPTRAAEKTTFLSGPQGIS